MIRENIETISALLIYMIIASGAFTIAVLYDVIKYIVRKLFLASI